MARGASTGWAKHLLSRTYMSYCWLRISIPAPSGYAFFWFTRQRPEILGHKLKKRRHKKKEATDMKRGYTHLSPLRSRCELRWSLAGGPRESVKQLRNAKEGFLKISQVLGF